MDLQAGQSFEFTPTGRVLTLSKVTETRVSWPLDFEAVSSWGKNKRRFSTTTKKRFLAGIEKGTYKLIK